jgi:hypothetical protein
MATLEQATRPMPKNFQPAGPVGYSPLSGMPALPPVTFDDHPKLDMFLRCAIPPFLTSADALRQYYRGGLIPQTRIFGNVKILGT